MLGPGSAGNDVTTSQTEVSQSTVTSLGKPTSKIAQLQASTAITALFSFS